MHKFHRHQALLTDLKATDSLRQLRLTPHKMLNLSSNDYLGLANDLDLKNQFINTHQDHADFVFGSSSSRLLTGNFTAHDELEDTLSTAYGRPALTFNSGYHMNIGILPAIVDDKTLILADKWVHASMIDGIRLAKQCGAKFYRFNHQNFHQLDELLTKHHAHYRHIIIMTESVFSMDGDITDLALLVAIKRRFDNVSLYVDEAHAVGVFGERGLGVGEMMGVMNEIDFLVGTFGKAWASVGGFIICDGTIKDALINTARPLIFSTNIPPVNALWSNFIVRQSLLMTKKRQTLLDNSQYFVHKICQLGLSCPSTSQIIPIIIGNNQQAINLAQSLQTQGFYALPIRPPTVPMNTARIRVCLTADITRMQIDEFCHILEHTWQGVQ